MRFFRQIGDLKGWKRFGFEVGIIVVGSGITLIAQDLISIDDLNATTGMNVTLPPPSAAP